LPDFQILSSNKSQISEVKNIKWLSKDECFEYIREYDEIKKNVIKKFYRFIEDITKYGSFK